MEHNKAPWIANKTKNRTNWHSRLQEKLHTHTPYPHHPFPPPLPKQSKKSCLYITCLMSTLQHICNCKIHWNGERWFTFLGNLILYQCIALCNTENAKVPPKQCCLLFSRISKGTRIKLRTDLEKETHWFVSAKNLSEKEFSWRPIIYRLMTRYSHEMCISEYESAMLWFPWTYFKRLWYSIHEKWERAERGYMRHSFTVLIFRYFFCLTLPFDIDMNNAKRQCPDSYFRFCFLHCFRVADRILIPWRTDAENF